MKFPPVVIIVIYRDQFLTYFCSKHVNFSYKVLKWEFVEMDLDKNMIRIWIKGRGPMIEPCGTPQPENSLWCPVLTINLLVTALSKNDLGLNVFRWDLEVTSKYSFHLC